MRRWSYIILVFQTLVFYPALADLKMSPSRVVKIRMSNKGLGRITVKGQRIEHVFAYPNNFNENLQLHESGNLYVSPHGLNGPMFLSIITEEGVSQDLEVRFMMQSAQPVILEPPIEVAQGPGSQALYEYYLKVFSRGGNPPGFTPYRSANHSCRAWQVNGTELRLSRAVWNSKYLLLEYCGEAARNMQLYPEAFSRTHDVAVKLSHGRVESGEQFKVYIVTKGGWNNDHIKRAKAAKRAAS